ncbi:MAG: RCC1 domain-containing protein [Firmicutes bacterium]|nr:RCC1 domain-containing protein [Bacillota bacterium]
MGGQLGDGTVADRDSPVQINALGVMNNYKIISVLVASPSGLPLGRRHSLAIDIVQLK